MLADVNWAIVASLATAAGTLVLAVATFSSVRSANRSAKASELALQEGMRPVLTQSRIDDPSQKIMFQEGYWVKVDGGRAGIEATDDVIYFVISLRNIGEGIAVLQAWDWHPDRASGADPLRPVEQFRRQLRDLYVPAGDVGLWQGALRDREMEGWADMAKAVRAKEPITLDLLYSDMAGGQRTVSRFTIVPWHDDTWSAAVVRHWMLDRDGPR
ncbi:MAG TPA: hypothetical protein VK277_01250 [Acidimicrobiales bacterium]|nr:hypothetical protein [Acidimicrobiales bacterium]